MMMPIRLASDVNGKICKMVKWISCELGDRRVIEVRSRLTSVTPTLSVHATSATCQEISYYKGQHHLKESLDFIALNNDNHIKFFKEYPPRNTAK